MKANEREGHALAKLLKVARMNAEKASRRLGDLEAARQQADASLRLLADAISDEEAAAQAAEIVGFAQLAGYLAGAAQKRAALIETGAKIAIETIAAERDLADAYAELKKLEHLVERSQLSLERGRRKTENASIDGAALARFVRSTRR